MVGRGEIGLDHGIPCLRLHPEHQIVGRHAGVVHQDRDGAQIRLDAGDHRGNGVGVSDITADGRVHEPTLKLHTSSGKRYLDLGGPFEAGKLTVVEGLAVSGLEIDAAECVGVIYDLQNNKVAISAQVTLQ